MADKRERYTLSRRLAALAGMAALAAALFLPQTAHAQNYPNRPVRLISAVRRGRRCRRHGAARYRKTR